MAQVLCSQHLYPVGLEEARSCAFTGFPGVLMQSPVSVSSSTCTLRVVSLCGTTVRKRQSLVTHEGLGLFLFWLTFWSTVCGQTW